MEQQPKPQTPKPQTETEHLKRRRNQVRDALNRCNDIVKIEELAAILRV